MLEDDPFLFLLEEFCSHSQGRTVKNFHFCGFLLRYPAAFFKWQSDICIDGRFLPRNSILVTYYCYSYPHLQEFQQKFTLIDFAYPLSQPVEVQTSGSTNLLDGAKPVVNNGPNYTTLNWLARFLNHQQQWWSKILAPGFWVM